MDRPLDVFAYGSLISEPAAPDHVLGGRRAVLRGWRRVFHQRSHTRGCPPEAAPLEAAVAGFVDDRGVRFSLALGLVEDADSEVVGMCFQYDPTHAEAVLAELQRREGPGYHGRELAVEADSDVRTAWTWVSRIGHERVVDLPVAEQARVLRAGTPTRDIDGRARGVHYLTGVVRALETLGAPDPNLAELLDHIEPLPPA